MANRRLYRLVLDDGAVIVYRTDKNYGRQGVIFKDGTIRKEHTPYSFPDYIVDEAARILSADDFELKRGYTYGGYRCQVDIKNSGF